MLLGVLSDTHGDASVATAAIGLLQSRGAQFFLHCGDVGSQQVLDCLVGLPAAFVWGNCDWDRPALLRYAQSLGITCYGGFGRLELDGKIVGLMHGDDERHKRQLLTGQELDYLLQGHTHRMEDRRAGRTRLINPGALHRATIKTVALLNTANDALEFLQVEEVQNKR